MLIAPSLLNENMQRSSETSTPEPLNIEASYLVVDRLGTRIEFDKQINVLTYLL